MSNGDVNAPASILKYSIWSNYGNRTETFLSGSFQHANNFISAINNPEDLQFKRWVRRYSGHKYSIHPPAIVKSVCILIDAEKYQEAGSNAFWNITAEHPITKVVSSPTYIVAIAVVETNALLV